MPTSLKTSKGNTRRVAVQYSPGRKRVQQTLVFQTENEEGLTVLGCAKLLKDELFSAILGELRTLLKELEQFGHDDFYPQKWTIKAP
jgi:uncharacterized protein YjgD (DUF1641 family)